MKNLTEAELIERIQKQPKNEAPSYEEITHPDFEVWGRARGWNDAQAACLMAGLTPMSEPAFRRLFQKNAPLPLEALFPYYPISQTDLERMKNMSKVIIHSKLLVKVQSEYAVNPQALIAFCLKYPDLIRQIPQQLVEAVSIGPHLSLYLPDNFDCLDIQIPQTKLTHLPTPLEDPLSKELAFPLNNAKQQGAQEFNEISRDAVLNSPLTSKKPNQLAQSIIRAAAACIWKRNPKLHHKDIIDDPCIKTIRKLLTMLIGEKCYEEEIIMNIYSNEKIKESYTDQTISEWIRTVNPNYTPKK